MLLLLVCMYALLPGHAQSELLDDIDRHERAVQAHDDRNLARQLTPAEKKEKKTRKLLGAAAEGEACPVSLYRIGSLASAQNRFKVRVNAEARLPAETLTSFCMATFINQHA